MVLDLVDPLPQRVLAATQRTATQLRTQATRVNRARQREPIMSVNAMRLALVIGCIVWRLPPEKMIPTILAGEAVFTAWTRKQVSPTFHERNRRNGDGTDD